jgi:hypothetical protein
MKKLPLAVPFGSSLLFLSGSRAGEIGVPRHLPRTSPASLR